jgi:hypothetical protein
MMTPFRFLPVLALAAFFIPLLAAEADPAVAAPPASAPAAPAPGAIDATKIAGAEAVETKGQMTGLSFKDATTLTEADYKQIRKMEGLKSLAFAHGPDDASLKILSGMPAIETFTTNGAHLTDAGVATLATFPALQTLTFFHPGQVFTGTGLAALATLPHLESFSLGGSQKFTDAGLAAVATFPHLTALRIWHTAVTGDGVKALLALKLKSLMLGQTLDMKSKAALTDDSVAVVAGATESRRADEAQAAPEFEAPDARQHRDQPRRCRCAQAGATESRYQVDRPDGYAPHRCAFRSAEACASALTEETHSRQNGGLRG